MAFSPDGRLLASAFSILGRIGGDATSAGAYPGRPRLPLSVSSVGSEAMQPATYPDSGIQAGRSFSILGRIGGDATRWNLTRQAYRDKLSVSSVGSEAMQPVFLVLGAVKFAGFQYPRSDRRRCNAVTLAHGLAIKGTFSILGRIGGDATMAPETLRRDSLPFQYPRSDRRRCNDEHVGHPFCYPWLSVSSVGSEAMQQIGMGTG